MAPADRERLRARLAAPGFDEVRFADVPVDPRDLPADFARWLDAGHHADLTWLERGAAKRADPGLVLPGVRTMIVLGVNYLPDGRAAEQAFGYVPSAPIAWSALSMDR